MTNKIRKLQGENIRMARLHVFDPKELLRMELGKVDNTKLYEELKPVIKEMDRIGE